MRLKTGFIVVIGTVFAVLLSMGLGYAQEDSVFQAAPAETSTTVNNEVNKDNSGLPDTQWLWGEIVSVDAANQQLQVKYFDYEADTEKEIAIGIDNKTTFENVKAIDEIKSLDTVSIDYAAEADGKNIAKNISVEKPENIEQTPQPDNIDMSLEPAPPIKE